MGQPSRNFPLNTRAWKDPRTAYYPDLTHAAFWAAVRFGIPLILRILAILFLR